MISIIYTKNSKEQKIKTTKNKKIDELVNKLIVSADISIFEKNPKK
jgi:hypothetical protein